MTAVDPDLLERLTRDADVALVTGTNGKSTTTRLLAEALRLRGQVATNVEGANLPAGITAAVARGRSARQAVLEVDESYLGSVARRTRPRAVVLLNLSRDQLDRVSEVRRIAARWRRELADPEVFAPRGTVVANADDPLVVWAAEVAPAVTWVGCGQRWTEDSTLCPWCGALLVRDDGWRCTSCPARRPALDLWLDDCLGRRADGSTWTVQGVLPGRANRADALLASAAAAVCGVEPARAADAMAPVAAVAGRYEVVPVRDQQVRLLLAKNPAGWLEVLDVIEPSAALVLAVNAEVADGRDTSWLYDVPFERLAGRRVVVTGRRSADLAVRLTIAGVPWVRRERLADALAAAGPGRVDLAANYTAMQAARRWLAAHTAGPGPVRDAA